MGIARVTMWIIGILSPLSKSAGPPNIKFEVQGDNAVSWF